MRYLSTIILTIILAMGGGITHADAQETRHARAAEPFGGCAEAWQAPHSAGADQCRELGYVVGPRWSVDPRGVVIHSTLKHCRNEDQSRGPCTWNIGPRADGYGGGLAFLVRRDGSVRYVWATGPTSARWRWVTPRVASFLEREHPRAHRAWSRCVMRAADTVVVRCADGRRFAAS